LSEAGRAAAWSTEGPVQAEVFVLRMNAGVPELAGPCGPAPWYMEIGAEEDPVEVVSRLARNLMGEPMLVHSTSWRRDRGTVLLSFIVVIAGDQAPGVPGLAIGRAELARSAATAAPTAIAAEQVIEHGLRHLSWLAQDDETVQRILPGEWKRVLSGYVPAPFRHLP
jgi:hypothetical protein